MRAFLSRLSYLFHWLPAGAGLLLAVAAGLLAVPTGAQAVNCGSYSHGVCQGEIDQYAGGFQPGTGYGGFGGGDCQAIRTPVIFIHGNGDNASSWDAPPGQVNGYPVAPRSVYAEMKARGYNDCELFGVTYLSADERLVANAGKNYHQPAKYRILRDFIAAVKAYTGKSRVDIVAHSLGVTQALATLHHYRIGGSVRKFVNISGGLRGLYSCFLTGFANPLAPTCGAQNLANPAVFGFFPEGFAGVMWIPNHWTGSGTGRSLRQAPRYRSKTTFYTVTAGEQDQISCSSSAFWSACHQTSKFDAAINVRAQLDIGAGAHAAQVDLNWSDYSPFNLMGGDASSGVGHFRSKDNAGTLIQRMLLTDCTGLECAHDYLYGPAMLY